MNSNNFVLVTPPNSINHRALFEEAPSTLRLKKDQRGRQMKSNLGLGIQKQNGAVSPGEQDERAMLSALAATLRMRDAETQGHSERVVKFSLVLGRELGLNPAQMKSLEQGSLLHDIGKIGVPDSILRKPGSLTTAEWIRMREHPLLGMQILSGVDFLKSASFVVAQHHERWDGKGYPFGIRGREIDRNARIFAVADAFDAMTSSRVYHMAETFEAAAAELRRTAGKQFDPEVVEAFVRIPREAWINCMNGG
jgi:putative nucleotidyltransferase with HDIG domain